MPSAGPEPKSPDKLSLLVLSGGLERVHYALVLATAVLRVLVPLLAPQWLVPALVGAALAWCAAFALYLFVYTPWLFSTRLDGKDG